MKRTLVKLGGSLLSLPGLPDRLLKLLQQTGGSNCLLVGGGESADLVRQWDDRFSLGDKVSHRLAIHAMQLNGRMVAGLNSQLVFAGTNDDMKAITDAGQIPVLDPVRFINELETRRLPAQRLPASWDVTSDSIAAWLAQHLSFDCLLLAKSVDAPSIMCEDNVEEALHAAKLVDSQFATHCEGIPHIDWCNLRQAGDLSTIRLR